MTVEDHNRQEGEYDWRRFDPVVLEMLSDLRMIAHPYALELAEKEAGLIVELQGCALVRIITRRQVRDLADAADTSDISDSELREFGFADLIMEAKDSEGSLCYFAVEVNTGPDKGDVKRAIRNAEFLTRFTGKPAYAGIAGLWWKYLAYTSTEGVFMHKLRDYR